MYIEMTHYFESGLAEDRDEEPGRSFFPHFFPFMICMIEDIYTSGSSGIGEKPMYRVNSRAIYKNTRYLINCSSWIMQNLQKHSVGKECTAWLIITEFKQNFWKPKAGSTMIMERQLRNVIMIMIKWYN